MLSRRQFLAALLGAGASGAGVAAYARFIEPRWLRLRLQRLSLRGARFARPVRVLHLSDLHLSEVVSLAHIAHAIDMGLAAQPDLICLTGDYITGRLRETEAYRALLARLPGAAPTFATMGNHDGGAWVKYRGGYANSTALRTFITSCGIRCLHNTTTTLTVAGQAIDLVGVGDEWAAEFSPAEAFAEHDAAARRPTLVLSHNPDTKERLGAYRWDLLLCGHTHGGQVYIPVLGAPFAPVNDHRYIQGLRPWTDRWVHVSRGVGNVGGIRFNCRPEVNLLELGHGADGAV